MNLCTGNGWAKLVILASLTGLGCLWAPVGLEAALIMEVEVNPDPVQAGEVLDAQISITSTASSGTLTLRLLWPAELNGGPVVTDGGSCPGFCNPGEFLVWNLGTLGPGATRTVSFDDVLVSVADGTFDLDFDLLEGASTVASVTHTVEIQADSPLELAVDPAVDPVAANSTLTYELVYGNAGATSAEGAELTFPLPTGSSFVAASGNGMQVGSTVTWNLGSVAALAGGTERVTVQVGALATGTLLTVDAATFSGDVAFISKVTRAMAVSRVAPQDLALAVEVNPDPAQPSEVVDAQVTVSNPTGGTTGALSLRLLWPAELNGGPVTTNAGACPGFCNPGEYLEWGLGVLGTGASVTVSFDDVVTSVTSGRLIPLEFELLEGGQAARNISRTVRVESDSPLELAIDPLRDPVASGGLLTYELSYGNAGSASAENVELVFPVPLGTQFASATGGATHAGGKVTWNLGSLAAFAGGNRRVTVTVNALSAGIPIVVDAAHLAGDISFQSRITRAMAVSRVASEDLEMEVEVHPDPAQISEVVDAQVTVTNPAASTTGSLSLRMLWPAELNGGPVVTGGGLCPGFCNPGEYLEWVLGPLGPGASLTVGFDDVVASVASGRLIPLEFELLEGVLPARTQSHTVRVQADSPLELTIDPLTDPVVSGSSLTYELTYGNIGALGADSAELTFPLPVGTVFQSATEGGVLSGSIVRWNLGTIGADSGGRVAVTVLVTAPNASLLLVDPAVLAGEISFEDREARATAVSRVAVEALTLSIDVGPDPAQPSDILVGEFSIANPSGSATGTLTLRLLWPSELNGSPTVTGGASCPGFCNPGEFLEWNLGTLGPGGGVTVEFNDSVESVSNGTLIPLEVELLEGPLPARNVSQTVLVHPFADNDMDGIPDVFDPDDDNDGMPDWWEILHGLDPNDPSDASEDPDMDGATNLEEFLAGTDPNAPSHIFSDGFESGDTSAWS